MTAPPPDPAGHRPFSGQLVVFTGKLSTLGRREARALVERLGGDTADDVNARTTMLVVGAEGFPALGEEGRAGAPKSQKLKRAEELGAQGAASIRVVGEDEFCRMAGVPAPDALKRQYHALRDLRARYIHVREDHVRYLITCGVLHPALRTNADVFFAFVDVAVLKQLDDDLAAGASFRSIARKLMAAREGQLAFDFRLDAEPAKIIALDRAPKARPKHPELELPPIVDTALAEDYFRAASVLDDGTDGRREEAAVAYRKALEIDPYLVPALINLANIHYTRDELVEAQALYERAIGLEPDFFEAHFNLGNIYHDLGRFAEAEACYREALRLNPLYADAHFYLAVTFEKMGESAKARPHWRAYQQLAPNGEWVQLAREFSE